MYPAAENAVSDSTLVDTTASLIPPSHKLFISDGRTWTLSPPHRSYEGQGALMTIVISASITPETDDLTCSRRHGSYGLI
ncbi:hypothetical protein EVAR_13312_1 [Eumeta japonica]|uniref:Uncharacterized protein n=1 Tax=Eumeta variegata TaxID=151549 RepID=A0A4C1TS31_EUMVA|nr:hypothetical protein EVAR_13312_1 [Eumeta japonica]